MHREHTRHQQAAIAIGITTTIMRTNNLLIGLFLPLLHNTRTNLFPFFTLNAQNLRSCRYEIGITCAGHALKELVASIKTWNTVGRKAHAHHLPQQRR